MVDYESKAVKHSMILVTMLLFSTLFTYLLRIVLAINLKVEEYGLFYSGIALFSLLVLIRDIGLRNSIVKHLSEFIAKKNMNLVKGTIVSITIIHLIMSIIITLTLFILSEPLSIYYFKGIEFINFAKLVFVLFFISFAEEILTYSFYGFQKMRIFSATPAIRMGCVLGFSILFLKLGFGLFSPLLGYIITYLFLPIFYFPLFIKTTFPNLFKQKIKMNKKLLKMLLIFGVNNLVTISFVFILSYCDTIMLTLMTTFKYVGLYQTAQPTAQLVVFFSSAIALMLFPLASELWAKGEKEVLSRIINFIQKYILIITIPIAVIFATFSGDILSIMYTEKYLAAANAFILLSVGSIFYGIASANIQVIAGVGRPQINTKINLVATAINILLNLILIYYLGMIGAAIATTISFIFVYLANTIGLSKIIDSPPPWKNWIKISFSGMIMILSILMIKNIFMDNIYINILFSSTAGLIIYTLSLFFFNTIDIIEIKSIIKKLF